MKRTALAAKNSKSSGSSPSARRPRRGDAVKFVLYLSEDQGDLRRATLYRLIPDAGARKDGLLRVIDDSGEDYLYPADLFAPLSVPSDVAARLGQPERRVRSSR
jgi:hypothetical protein